MGHAGLVADVGDHDVDLGLAVYRGDLDAVQRVLARGVSPDQRWGSQTPLMVVLDEPPAYFGLTEQAIAEALLDAGASVDARDEDGRSPLHYATLSGPGATALLLKRGANVNAVASNGETPLHHAVQRESVEVVHLLLNGGADPSARNTEGSTPHDVASALPISDESVAILGLLSSPQR